MLQQLIKLTKIIIIRQRMIIAKLVLHIQFSATKTLIVLINKPIKVTTFTTGNKQIVKTVKIINPTATCEIITSNRNNS